MVWEKGLSMKHFFPFFIATLIFCILLDILPTVPVFAHQYDSFASAGLLSMEDPVSITIPACASEYYYFEPSHETNDTLLTYQVEVLYGTQLELSLYDSQGTLIKLISGTNGNNISLDYTEISLSQSRYFLQLHNMTKQDLRIQIYIHCSNVITATDAPQDTPKTATKRKKASDAKSTHKPSNTDKPINTNTPAPKSKYGTNQSDSGINQKSPDTSAKPTITPQKNTSDPDTKSIIAISSHFLRMSTGHSMSLPDALKIKDISWQKLQYENITPEKISLQNGIIYTKNSGLAVILIHYGTYTTSCTLYIQK